MALAPGLPAAGTAAAIALPPLLLRLFLRLFRRPLRRDARCPCRLCGGGAAAASSGSSRSAAKSAMMAGTGNSPCRSSVAGGPLLGDLDALPAALAVAEDAHLAVMVAPGSLRLLIQPHLHRLLQDVDVADITGAVGGLDKGIVLGQTLQSVLIGLLLIFQAAHEPAGAGNFSWGSETGSGSWPF